MPHPRQTIRAAVAAALSGNTAAGTNVVPSRVVPSRLDNLPTIAVYTLDESVDPDSAQTAPRELTRNPTIVVEAWTEAPDAATNIEDAMDDLALEIETALDADILLGGAVGGLGLILSDTALEVLEAGRRLIGAVQMTYAATYYTFSPAVPEDGDLDSFITMHGQYNLANEVQEDEQAEDQVTVVAGVEFYGTEAPDEVTSYARDSPATAVTEVDPVDGAVITEFDADEYAYGLDGAFSHDSEFGALVPPAATNLLGRSRNVGEFSFVNPWQEDDVNASGGSGIGEVTGPLGDTVSRIAWGSTTGDRWIFQTVTGLTIGEQYTFSTYLRKPTVAELGPLTSVDPASTIDLRVDTGVFAVIEQATVTLTEQWDRYSVTFTATDTFAFVRLVLGSREGAWMPQCLQLEAGAVATQWIRTADAFGSTATREATVIDYLVAGQAGQISNLGAGPVVTSGAGVISEVQGELVAKVNAA
jgi:hypothetical protein